jgi:hypothetical protein
MPMHGWPGSWIYSSTSLPSIIIAAEAHRIKG